MFSFARLARVDSDRLKSSWCNNNPLKLMTCTVLANGEVTPAWKEDTGSTFIEARPRRSARLRRLTDFIFKK